MINPEALRNKVSIGVRLATVAAVIGTSLAGRPSPVESQRGQVQSSNSTQELQFCPTIYNTFDLDNKISLAAGDWNTNGLTEVAEGSYPEEQVVIYSQSSARELEIAKRIKVGSQVVELTNADLRGNGRENLIIFSNDRVLVLEHIINSDFDFKTISYELDNFFGINAGTVADVDQNPRTKEIVYQNQGDLKVLSLEGDELVSRTPLQRPDATQIIGELISGDFNGDGGDDVAGMEVFRGDLYLWLSPCYQIKTIRGLPITEGWGLGVGDLDKNGKDDISIPNHANGFDILWGGDFSRGHFEFPATTNSSIMLWGSAIADFDRNNKMDLFMGNHQVSDGDFMLTFKGRNLETTRNLSGNGVYDEVVEADVNGDNRLDYFYSNGRQFTTYIQGCGYNLIPSPNSTPERVQSFGHTCPDGRETWTIVMPIALNSYRR